MAVRIRLRRIGAKKKPFYRVVVADSRSPRDGRFLDTLGWYDPLSDPVKIEIDAGKAMRWLSDGAVPTDSARSVLSKAGILARGGAEVASQPTEVGPAGIAPEPGAAGPTVTEAGPGPEGLAPGAAEPGALEPAGSESVEPAEPAGEA